MARKVFISILGTGFYSECKYVTDEFKSTNTKFAQEALLESYNAKEWRENDIALFFLTDYAKTFNWNIKERKHNQDGLVEYKGLKYVMEDMNLPIQIVDKFIPNGKNEEEMWEIFTTIFNVLEENDEVYIDLTHSFRYLPMLLLVLSNYAKFLKNIKVVSLSYGNFEARNHETNEAPIVNLLPITALQDWTFAAADYLKNGNVERLVDLSSTQLKPILREAKGTNKDAILINKFIKKLQEATEDFQTCRGLNIINSSNINALKSQLEDLESTFIKPLDPVIKKISDSFEVFDKEQNIQNGFNAAKWCLENGLYQQSATILQENVVSFFCNKHQIDIANEDEREIINSVFFIIIYKITDSEDSWSKVARKYKDKVYALLEDSTLTNKEIVDSFGRLTELRNDINHAGMRTKQKPLTVDQIKAKIQNEMEIITSILN